MHKLLHRFSFTFATLGLAVFLLSSQSWAGSLVFGPERFQRAAEAPEAVRRTFSIIEPTAQFWLQVTSGSGGSNLVEGAFISINGRLVAGPSDFQPHKLEFSKEIQLQANNVLEVKLLGVPGSFLTIEIRIADPNPTVFNSTGDLWANNEGEFVALWWEPQEGSSQYTMFRSFSVTGPWETLTSIPLSKGVDFTPDARTVNLCYRVEGIDASGAVIRSYEPVCVPKFVETPTGISSAMTREGRVVVHTRAGTSTSMQMPVGEQNGVSVASTSLPYNTMCLTDNAFVGPAISSTPPLMTVSEIRTFLADRNSFLKSDVVDVDGRIIDPPQLIYDGANASAIDPLVLLTTLQKEQSAVTVSQPFKREYPMRHIMGYDPNDVFIPVEEKSIREQIADGAAQFRRDINRLTLGNPTAGGWRVNVPKASKDPLIVTPASKSVATLFSYTEWVGEGWGGAAGIGGNYNFCHVWTKFPLVTFLSLVGGDPSIPGDGIVVTSLAIVQSVFPFDLNSPFPIGAALSNGFTMTAFLPSGNENILQIQYNLDAPGRPLCSAAVAHSGPQGNVIYGGVTGYFQATPTSVLDFVVNAINQAMPSCGVTLNDLYLTRFLITTRSQTPTLTLDAVSMGIGQNAFQGTRIQ